MSPNRKSRATAAPRSGGADAARRPPRARPRTPPDPAPPLREAEWLFPLAIAAAALLAYANTFAVPYLLDDPISLVENESVRSLWPPWRALWGPDQTSVAGRPILNFSFALCHAVAGYTVWIYHAGNIAIHVSAALALFGLIRRALWLPRQRAAFGEASARLAFAAALLWALHPLQTQAVTYIMARSESLSGLFYILTLYCFARAAEGAHEREWSAAAVAACALGMGTKETVATAPIMALLFDRSLVSGSFKAALGRRSGLHGALCAAWLILALLMMPGPRSGSAGFSFSTIGPLDYLKIESEVLVRYLRLSIWPSPLIFDYGHSAKRSWSEVAPSFALVSALFAAALWALWRRPAAGFLAASFFLILGPTSSIVPVADPCWEFRMYLPLAPLAVLAVFAARRAARAALPGRAVRRAEWGILLAVAALLAALTLRRNHDYRSEIALMEDTIRKRPGNARPHNDKGNALIHAGKPEEAIACFERALEIDSSYYYPAFNLGMAYSMLKRDPEAVAAYQRALKIDPADPVARNNLGASLARLGRMKEAAAEFAKAVELAPDYEEARANLAKATARR